MPDYSVRHALYFNVTHTIRHLSFGTYFPGQRSPLDNRTKGCPNGTAEMRYLVKVVPTTFQASLPPDQIEDSVAGGGKMYTASVSR